MKPCFLFILTLLGSSVFAQKANEELTLLVTPAGDSLMMSAEKIRTVKIGDKTKHITTQKSYPVVLNGKAIFKITIDTPITDSTRFAIYMGTPLRTIRDIDSNIITTHINYYKQINHIVDSCFGLFDEHMVNGVYSMEIENVVVDEHGKIVYYQTDGVNGHAEQTAMRLNGMKGYHKIPEPLQELFNKRLHILLTSAQLDIFIRNGIPTPFCYGDFGTSFSKGMSDEDTPKNAKPKPPETWRN